VVLSSGERVPYPEPSCAAATKVGVANRRRDTAAELRLRSELHARGLRFRKDLLVRAGTVGVHPDIVFTRAKVAVFLDGCFWHACPEHGTMPKRNVGYWQPKLAANTERDQRVNEALTAAGWLVLRVWEHEDLAFAAIEIEPIVRSRSAQ
jgi:DNA mismatch endonuclease, patch repair protein